MIYNLRVFLKLRGKDSNVSYSGKDELNPAAAAPVPVSGSEPLGFGNCAEWRLFTKIKKKFPTYPACRTDGLTD